MPKCYCILAILTVLYVARGEDILDKDAEVRDETDARSLRDDFGSDQWRAVQQHPIDSSGWIGTNDRQSQDETPGVQPQKRRRLRKRKRRPPVMVDSEAEVQVRPRRRRPVRLDEVRDTWREMEAESPKRNYNRRRVSPVYHPDLSSGVVSATVKFGDAEEGGVKVRDPYIAMQEAEEKVRRKKLRQQTTTIAPTSVVDIKALIKQNNGLSLSEILQKQNLSLSDLLGGKEQAISALVEKPQEFFEYKNPVTETSPDVVDKEILEAQRKRLSSLYRNSANKIYSDVTKFDVVTEESTEKRIFVPSHPKFYTSVNYRQFDSYVDQTTENLATNYSNSGPVVATSTSAPKRLQDNVITPNKVKLPITSAKMHQSLKKLQESERLPPKAIKISVSELFGFIHEDNETKRKEEEKIDQGPFKMLFNLEELVKQNMDSINTILPMETTTKPEATSPIIKTYATAEFLTKKPVQQKLKVTSAKDEIMEVLKDRRENEKLSKILRSRNMTVEELVQQRERGSSQIHLADIFHNKTKEPEPIAEHIGEIKMESVDRRPKTTLRIPYQNYPIDIKSLPDVSISSEEIITSEKIRGTSFPTYKIETNKRSKETPPVNIPIWKTIYPSVYNAPTKDIFGEDIQKIDDIENTIAEAVNEGRNDEPTKNNYDYEDYIQLPIGVKSAIFASLAIIGISLIIFLTILVIFRWTQRHKQRLCYGGSFSCSKIKSPILQTDARRSIRTFVSETLGRKKNIYASRLQSMSDSWDSDKQYQ